MKWLRYTHEGQAGFGQVHGDSVHVHEGDLFDAPRATGATLPRAAVQPLPPCRPGKLIGLWNNFRESAAKNGWAEPAEPLYFLKSPGSVLAAGQPIPVPAGEVGRVAYEGELAVVIGRRARAVAVEDAAAHIFGFCAANDVTAIEVLSRDPSFMQWTRAKSFDGFCPLGPVIETDFDPAAARLVTRVGGRERQNYALSDMFFPPAVLVSRLSQDMTLEPGDVILCGTSLGVLPMKPGTEVAVAIDGLERLLNTFG